MTETDLIRRSDAIDANCEDWCGCKHKDCQHESEEDKHCDGCDTVVVLKKLPSANPDLSGYSDRLWKSAYASGYERCRQDVIDAMRQSVCGDTWEVDKAIEAVEKLPSAQPEQRTGHWKQFALYKNNLNQDRASMFCSECEAFFDGYPEIKEWKFCPECGARMVDDVVQV